MRNQNVGSQTIARPWDCVDHGIARGDRPYDQRSEATCDPELRRKPTARTPCFIQETFMSACSRAQRPCRASVRVGIEQQSRVQRHRARPCLRSRGTRYSLRTFGDDVTAEESERYVNCAATCVLGRSHCAYQDTHTRRLVSMCMAGTDDRMVRK